MTYNQELIDQVAIYVTKLFDKFQTAELTYHNLHHTHKVVERVKEISANYGLTAEFSFVVDTAAWFHDTGHLFGTALGHEEKSVLIMKSYFEKTNVEKEAIYLVEQSINATRFPYQPKSLLDEIVCDADSYHLGTEEFLVTDELVKEEFILRNKFLPLNWNENTLHMLKQHQFFTSYCKLLLQNGKEKNVEIIYGKIAGAFKK